VATVKEIAVLILNIN